MSIVGYGRFVVVKTLLEKLAFKKLFLLVKSG